MDAIDRKIVRVLQKDGRISNQDLAERVGLSPTPCARRIAKLEDDGVIRGYGARLDQAAAGYPLTVFVFVDFVKGSFDGGASIHFGVGQEAVAVTVIEFHRLLRREFERLTIPGR